MNKAKAPPKTVELFELWTVCLACPFSTVRGRGVHRQGRDSAQRRGGRGNDEAVAFALVPHRCAPMMALLVFLETLLSLRAWICPATVPRKTKSYVASQSATHWQVWQRLNKGGGVPSCPAHMGVHGVGEAARRRPINTLSGRVIATLCPRAKSRMPGSPTHPGECSKPSAVLVEAARPQGAAWCERVRRILKGPRCECGAGTEWQRTTFSWPSMAARPTHLGREAYPAPQLPGGHR